MKGNCSIIIPTFNRAQELKKLLQNLLLQTVLEQIEGSLFAIAIVKMRLQ